MRTRRTPHGVRGLKYLGELHNHFLLRSHPAWGAWIEIWGGVRLRLSTRRTPHGVRGLKFERT